DGSIDAENNDGNPRRRKEQKRKDDPRLNLSPIGGSLGSFLAQHKAAVVDRHRLSQSEGECVGVLELVLKDSCDRLCCIDDEFFI
ncbi:MAG: hypothetical protein RL486_941, partial [Actinomycetota bacterium]